MRKLLVGLGLGLAAALVAALAGLSPLVQTVEYKTYDWRMRHTADPASARRDIILVAIDEASIKSLEPLVGRWPWPRMVHGALIDFLSRGRPKVIVYDVIFGERDRKTFEVGGQPYTGEDSDKAFADSVARAGNVVTVAEVSAESAGDEKTSRDASGLWKAFQPGEGFEERPSASVPFAELARASRAVGHSLAVYDSDGPIRRFAPFVRVGGSNVPALPLAAAMVALDVRPQAVRLEDGELHLGPRVLPVLPPEVLPSFYGERRVARRALINYPGGVFDERRKAPTFTDYSFYRLFYSEQQLVEGEGPLVDPSVFRDAVVVVGTTAAGAFDLFTTPLAGRMPGMQVHASVIDNILSSRFLVPAPWWLDALALVALSVLAGAAVTRLGVWRGLGVAVTLLGAGFAASVSLFAHGTWVHVIEPGLGVSLATFSGVAYQYLVEDREKRKVKRLFSRYVSRDVCEQLMADPSRARLGGSRRTMTVLFSDIRGFTTFSEGGEPEAIVAQLNEYFTRMVQVVFDHRGTLDKFVGDAVMALFGAPLDDPDHAEHAVQAALAMGDELAELNRRWSAESRPTLDIGIGINTGDMVAGNIGSESIMSYTVIGDAVNLAARLESLNKQYRTRVIVSQSTRDALKGRYDIRALGDVVVKGKTQPAAIYEVKRESSPAARELATP